MKKTILTRGLALLLVLIMAFSVLVACGDGETNTPSGPKETTPEANLGDPENPNFAAVDYGGEFNFICQPYKDNTAYSVDYMVADGEDAGNQIHSAVYRRNSLLEEKYNITFNQIQTPNLNETVRAQIMSGSTDFDVIVGSCRRLATFAKENLLLDLLSVEKFDMSKSYWDQNAKEQLKIGDKLYFTNCDFNIQEIAFVVYFNKEVIK